MNSALFLLAINAAIGLSFATAFLALSRGSGVRLGRWCAAGFLAAAATVSVEACAAAIPSVRLTSTLSFGLLMLALTAIAAGLVRHYRPGAPVAWLGLPLALAVLVNALVVFDLPRGSWGQALGYQGPFAAMAAFAAGVVVTGRRRPVDLALALVLGLSAAQFVAKAVLSGLAGGGPGVRDYVVSAYAFYAQTAGGILSLMLGLALLGVVADAVMAETALRLQRDALSGLLNRAAFLERVARVRLRGAAALVLCDLDRFKAINDRFGHAAGDEVIRAFGASLRAGLSEDAACGRLGGEEFCFLLPTGDPDAVRTAIEALRDRVRRTRYARVPDGLPVTASFGIAITDGDEPFDHALHRADMALYAAKAAGRDGYRFAPPAGPGQGGEPAGEARPFRIPADTDAAV